MFSKPEIFFMPVWVKASRALRNGKAEDEKKTSFTDLLQTEADYVFRPFETAMKRNLSPQLTTNKAHCGIFEFS